MTKMNAPAPTYRMPGKAPLNPCQFRNIELTEHHGLKCNRPAGHGGRHAYVLWPLDGLVRAVWARESAKYSAEAA